MKTPMDSTDGAIGTRTRSDHICYHVGTTWRIMQIEAGMAASSTQNDNSVADDELIARVKRAERLAAARTDAYEALKREAEVPELKEIANRLGRALGDTADDEALWADLAASASRVRALPDAKRDKLALVVNLDWSLLLDQLGYCPPPPARELSDDLRVAMSGLLSGSPDVDPREVAQGVRSIATELIQLSGTPNPSRSRLSRALRKGLRVAGQALVPVAAGALGAAVILAVPHVGIPAFVIAMAHHTTTTTIVEAGVQNAVSGGGDLVKASALAWFKKKQDKQTAEVASLPPGAAVDAADRAAVASIQFIKPSDIAQLRTDYETARALFGDHERRDSSPNSPRATAQEVLAKCDQKAAELTSLCTRQLFDCWDAATGAEWATPQFHALAQETSDSIAVIAELLRVRRDRHVYRMHIALDELSKNIITLSIWLDRHVEH
jgi:hypothetical protein